MAATQNMPDITFDTATLIRWGNIWKGTVGSSKKDGTPTTKNPNCFDKKQGMDFTKEVIDPGGGKCFGYHAWKHSCGSSS